MQTLLTIFIWLFSLTVVLGIPIALLKSSGTKDSIDDQVAEMQRKEKEKTNNLK